ncbi:MAG: non-heme iron oxygenase ferredoxin subunit [Actinocrinis sp.]
MSRELVWHLIGALADFEEDRPEAVDVDGTPIAVVRTSEGPVYAIYDVCSHANVALSEGEVVDGEIECWLHGSMFSLSSGKPTSLPAVEPVPVYPVKIEGDDLYVAVQRP